MHADNAERHQAEQIAEQDEHEQREDIGHELFALLAHIRHQQRVDETGHRLDRHLPTARNDCALHAHEHECPKSERGDHHPQCAVGEGDIVAAQCQMVGAEERLDQELVHRINLA